MIRLRPARCEAKMNTNLAKALASEAAQQPQNLEKDVVAPMKQKMHDLLDALLGAGLKPGLYNKEGKRYDGTDETSNKKAPCDGDSCE